MSKMSAKNRLRVQQAISHLKMVLVETELSDQLDALANVRKNIDTVTDEITPRVKPTQPPKV